MVDGPRAATGRWRRATEKTAARLAALLIRDGSPAASSWVTRRRGPRGAEPESRTVPERSGAALLAATVPIGSREH